MPHQTKAPFTIAPWALTAYFTLFALYGGIALTYVRPDIRVATIETVLPGFYSHASNVVLSGVLVMTYGLVRLLYGASAREIALFASAVVAGNYIYEVFLTLYNTRDIVDAHYGAASTAVAFGLMAMMKNFGLRSTRQPVSQLTLPDRA